MQIISISWVRNEEDIIEDFVRHHAPIMDRMVIVNNASTDRTDAILKQLLAEGLPLDLQFSPSPIHSQKDALTALMHSLAVSSAPDWILPLDADEFLVSTTGNARDDIAHLSMDSVHHLPWRTYVPLPSDDLLLPSIPTRIQHRRSLEQPQYHKILIPRSFQGTSYRIPLGSHQLEMDEKIVPMIPTPSLFLAHFPVRSPLQIRNKITENWERHKIDPDRLAGQNFHWERLYDAMKHGPAPTMEQVSQIAREYAADPLQKNEIVFDPIAHPLQ